MRNLTNGILKENPVFVLMLGLCPSLAVTTTVVNAIGMGMATLAVLLCSNIIISIMKNFIPDEIHIPAYIVIIASFVTIVDLLIQAYSPSLSESLGMFVPLIVVNCIILGRAEAFASSNSVGASIADAIGMGLGFTFALIIIAFFREFFGAGTLTIIQDISKAINNLEEIEYKKYISNPVAVLAAPAGALMVVGYLKAFVNLLKK